MTKFWESDLTNHVWVAEAGLPYLTAGESVAWDEGRRLLVSEDAEGKLMTIESRQRCEDITQQGPWVCFGVDPLVYKK